MKALRVIIADDERPARAYVRSILETCEGVTLVGEAANGVEAVALIERESPDLALLDLQMPELDGMEVVQMLTPERMPLIAFVTAFDEYAVRAFELNAVDYLLKPVDAERLKLTISRTRERIEHRGDPHDHVQQIIAAFADIRQQTPQQPLRRIPVRQRDDILFVPVNEIASVVADGELLYLTTMNGVRYVITFTLKDLEARLNDKQFVRLSRSAIINVDAMIKVSPMPGGTYVVTLSNKQQLPVSRMRSRVLRDTLFRL